MTTLLSENGCFSDDVKLAKVNPIFKKNDDLDKENYSPVSVLFNRSKISERIIDSRQIDVFMQHKLSNLLASFRKKHNTQHCLMHMLKTWKNILAKGGYV